MIDFHGRALRLTRATCADRSICLSCTRGSSFLAVRPNAIRPGSGAAGRPGTNRAEAPGNTLRDRADTEARYPSAYASQERLT